MSMNLGSERPPFETFKGAICMGCYALGTACGTCEKCAWERARIEAKDRPAQTAHTLFGFNIVESVDVPADIVMLGPGTFGKIEAQVNSAVLINNTAQQGTAGPTNFPVPGEQTALDALANLSQEEINWLADVFSYHTPGPEDLPKYQAIRTAAKNFAMVVLLNTPKCADRTAAIRKIREAGMEANAAIALKGRV